MNYPAVLASIPSIIKDTEERLTKYKINGSTATSILLTTEELLVGLINNAPPNAEIKINYTSPVTGGVYMKIEIPGKRFNLHEADDVFSVSDLEGIDDDVEHAIRNIILNSKKDIIKTKYKKPKNIISITLKPRETRQIYFTLSAMVIALILGFLLKSLLPENILTGMNYFIFSPFKQIFLNALKALVGPVVFFSIISCISQFTDFKQLGKIGAKVIGLYFMTTIMAITVGLSVGSLLSPEPLDKTTLSNSNAVIESPTGEISIIDTIINIVPDNIVKPFYNSEMLQIIFLALIFGIATNLIGHHSETLRNIFEACNQLFLKATTLIIKFIPLAVFCSMMSLVFTTGAETLLSILSLTLGFVGALTIMMVIYCLMVLIFAKVNPLTFIRKYLPAFVNTFSLSSSNASMPMTLQICNGPLGISPKISSFSIPLGATLNMDGTCVFLSVTGLFMANLYDLPITPAVIFSMIFTILVLSVGAPGIPGSGIICLSLLLTEMGIPAEALGLIMGIDALYGMFRASSNVTGDVAVTLIVARSEKLLDPEKYNTVK